MKDGSSQDQLAAKLGQLRKEHRALDAEISRLSTHQAQNQLELQRLKRQKLRLKDRISQLKSQLHPNIIA